MNKQYGEFSRQGDEYIIYRADTPQAWSNTLTNGKIISQISAAGEGFAARAVDQEQPPRPDRPSRHFYIRDADSGEWWEMTSALKESVRPQTVHGLSYTRLRCSQQDIDASVTFFLPSDDPCEIWQIKIRNTSQAKRRLSIFAVVEWPYDALNSFQTEVYDGSLIAVERARNGQPLEVNFMASDHVCDSFDTLASTFLGRHNSYLRPSAVTDGRCSRSLGSGSPPLGAWQKNMTLGANGETELSLIIGQVTGRGKTVPLAKRNAQEQIRQIVQKFRAPQAIGNAFEAAKQHADEQAGRNLAKSPDPLFDYFYNYWLGHQFRSAVHTSPSKKVILSQLPALVALDPSSARITLERTLGYLHRDGQIRDSHGREYGQELVRGVISYLKETADLAFLDTQVSYVDAGEGSVLQHVIRIMDYANHHLSRRNLPTSKPVTSLDHQETSEVQIQACLTYANLRSLVPILDTIGEHELVHKYERHSTKLREAVNEHFWDGAWYGSQIIDGKCATGFKRNDHAKISLAEQAWAVISGVATTERGKKAISSARTHLGTKFGLATLWPAYPHSAADSRSAETAGAGQNGGILPEENALAIMAMSFLGEGDEAYKLWQLSCPAHLATRPEHYHGAPFAYADFIYGPSHPFFGRASDSLSDETPGVMWQAMAESVLGIQPVLGGLKIDPCLPRDWRQVEVTRHFRGAEYHIRILNSFRQNRGVDRVLVNGVRITGQVVPVQGAGVHFVEVVLG